MHKSILNNQILWDSKDNYGRESGKGVYFMKFSSTRFQSVARTIILK